MVRQPFDGKGSHRLSRAACGQVPISGTPKRLYYCVILQYVHNLHMWPHDGHPCFAIRLTRAAVRIPSLIRSQISKYIY